MKLMTKFAPKAVIPTELYDGCESELVKQYRVKFKNTFTTIDGVDCRIYLLGVTNTKVGGRESLNRECMEIYKMPFDFVESMFAARIGCLKGYWAVVEMEKI